MTKSALENDMTSSTTIGASSANRITIEIVPTAI